MNPGIITKLLKKNNNIQYIGCGITLLHSYGISAAFNFLKDTKKVNKGLILCAPHVITGRLLKRELFSLSNNEVIFYDIDSLVFDSVDGKFKEYIKSLKIIKKNMDYDSIFVACTHMDYKWTNIISSIFPKKKVIYIVIDDGIGSYTNEIKNRLQYELYENINSCFFKKLEILIKVCISGLCYKLFQHILVKNNEIIDFRIFLKDKNGQFLRNELAASYYANEFKKYAHISKIQGLELFEESFLFNTQCLEENKITDGKVDLNLYKKVLKIIKKINGKVIIKPHPREINIEKYKMLDCYVYEDKTYSQEVILSALDKKPKCIISIFSSTLLNAYGLYNIPVISLAKIMLNMDINNVFKKYLKDFVKQYHKIFIFPRSMEELEGIIKKLEGKN